MIGIVSTLQKDSEMNKLIDSIGALVATALLSCAVTALVFVHAVEVPPYFLRPLDIEVAKEKCSPHKGLSGVAVTYTKTFGVKYYASCEEKLITWGN